MLDWLFRPRPSSEDLDKMKAERWETNFGSLQEKRFRRDEGQGYAAAFADRKFKLEIVKPRLFAWNVNPWHQYRDCVLEGDFSFGAANGSSAVGLIFRYTNDENYYSALVSRSGLFRFDVIFNGKPLILIPWVSLPEAVPEKFHFRLISHGQHFSFYLENEWVAETADDHLQSGRNGWAAQNYGDRTRAEFYLHRFFVDSRPFEVEASYLRWTRYIEADPAQRRVLAQALFGFEKFVEAQIQMRRALAGSEPSADDQFFLAQCAIRQERLDEAFRLIGDLLSKNPTWELALREKANLLYLQNRYLELRDYLTPLMERLPDDDLLWNLRGHAETGLGNFAKAETAYRKATELNPGMPFFLVNLGRTQERLKKTAEAAASYLSAGRDFFRQEAWDEVEDLLKRLELLGADKTPEAGALRGKLLFQQGDHHRSKLLLEEALSAGIADSSVYYLHALLKKEEGDRKTAIKSLQKAIKLEGDFALYHFRLAELLKEDQKDFEPELQQALRYGPGDAWILNFRGLTAPDNTQKTFYLEKAHLARPDELDIVLNLADHYHKLGRRDEAFNLLDPFLDRAAAPNLRGNFYTREERFNEALAEYEKAMSLDPSNADYKENAAVCALELQHHLRAEEILLDLLELKPTVKVYTALGNLMRIIGDFSRAEVSLRAALELDPVDVSALVELGLVYLNRQKFSQVEDVLRQLKKHAGNPSVEELNRLHLKLTTELLVCADCGRTWRVPLILPIQGSIRVHGEVPDEAPAGRSPVTGKLFCVGCAQKHMKDGRFVCPDSGELLQLKEDSLRYLLRQALEKHQP